jgi:hypothetical protein
MIATAVAADPSAAAVPHIEGSAASPDLAVLLGLRSNKMALQAGQDRLGLGK